MFVQDNELVVKFMKSKIFKQVFKESYKEIFEDLKRLIRFFGIDSLKDAILDLMLPIEHKNISSSCYIIRRLFEFDQKDFSFECLNTAILPFIDNLNERERSFLCEKLFRIFAIFKKGKYHEWKFLKLNLLKLMNEPKIKNWHNLKISKVRNFNSLLSNE